MLLQVTHELWFLNLSHGKLAYLLSFPLQSLLLHDAHAFGQLSLNTLPGHLSIKQFQHLFSFLDLFAGSNTSPSFAIASCIRFLTDGAWLVFKSSVQSSFWTLIKHNCNCNQLQLQPNFQATGLNRRQPVDFGSVVVYKPVSTSLSRDWLRLVWHSVWTSLSKLQYI